MPYLILALVVLLPFVTFGMPALIAGKSKSRTSGLKMFDKGYKGMFR
jgi:hypothetical protein